MLKTAASTDRGMGLIDFTISWKLRYVNATINTIKRIVFVKSFIV
jgi:hypothetical protein